MEISPSPVHLQIPTFVIADKKNLPYKMAELSTFGIIGYLYSHSQGSLNQIIDLAKI